MYEEELPEPSRMNLFIVSLLAASLPFSVALGFVVLKRDARTSVPAMQADCTSLPVMPRRQPEIVIETLVPVTKQLNGQRFDTMVPVTSTIRIPGPTPVSEPPKDTPWHAWMRDILKNGEEGLKPKLR